VQHKQVRYRLRGALCSAFHSCAVLE
jgi:hypothetical protein